MSAKAGKRPLRSLTAHEKLDAIRRVHDGESKASVARDIGVPESTLRGWCKNEDKISYLSRQSSPETDDSALEAPEKKRQKVAVVVAADDGMQPFNLSLKPAYSPSNGAAEARDFDAKPPKAAEALKTTPHASERERNRAELARLSIELGLNRPEMYLPAVNAASSNLADLTANIGLLAQWNTILLQQQQQQKTQGATNNNNNNNSKKVASVPADTSSAAVVTTTTATPSSTTVAAIAAKSESGGEKTPQKPPPPLLPEKQPQSVEDSVWYWLKTQQAMLGLAAQGQHATPAPPGHHHNGSLATTATATPANGATTTTIAGGDQNSSWFWKWYKQFAYNPQAGAAAGAAAAALPDKPILYHQLTKDKDSENISAEEKPHRAGGNKARAVLDNLLLNNNNIAAAAAAASKKEPPPQDPPPPPAPMTRSEAVEHGDKFLRWLETCGDPTVTTVHIMQLQYLLNNIRNAAQERRNGDLAGKAKVKRK